MADVPLLHPVPLRSTSGSSRLSTVRSSIFSRTPWHEPFSGGLPIRDGSLGPIQNSSEPMMTAIPEHLEEPNSDVSPSLSSPLFSSDAMFPHLCRSPSPNLSRLSIHWEDRPVFWELRTNPVGRHLTGGTRRIRWIWPPWDNRQRI